MNVAPQKKAAFYLTYEELLQRRDEQYEIVINIHPGQPVKDLSVEVRISTYTNTTITLELKEFLKCHKLPNFVSFLI